MAAVSALRALEMLAGLVGKVGRLTILVGVVGVLGGAGGCGSSRVAARDDDRDGRTFRFPRACTDFGMDARSSSVCAWEDARGKDEDDAWDFERSVEEWWCGRWW